MPQALRYLSLLIGVAVVVYLIIDRSGEERTAAQTRYQGKTLAEWASDLRHPDYAVQLRAAAQLEAIGPEAQPAVPALRAALRDRDPGMRWAAAKALMTIGTPTPAIPVLVQSLGIRGIRLEAAKRLVQLGAPAVPALCQSLDDPKSAIHLPVVEVLRDLGPAAHSALPSLIPMLCQPRIELRREAARALGRINTPEAVAPLIGALADPAEPVQLAAADALTHIGAAAVPELAKTLREPNKPGRQACARILAHLGLPAKSALPALGDCLADADPRVRQQAARAIVWVGGDWQPTLPVLFTSLQDRSFRWDSIETLVRIGGPAVSTLCDGLNDTNELIRADVARGLGRFGLAGREAVPTLTRALRDQDRSVRREAVASLGRLAPVAKDALPAMLKLCQDADPLNRSEVAIALAHFGSEAAIAVPGLIANLADTDQNVCQESAKALLAIGPAAIPGLQLAQLHENETVRRSASDLLQRLAD